MNSQMSNHINNEFAYLLRVRYAECDAQGVVFNARFGEYVDVATTEFTRVIWGGYQAMVNTGFDNKVVNLTISWHAPARFDDVLVLSVRLKKLGTTSYTLKVLFRNFLTDVLIAEAEITYVMVKADTSAKVAMPNKFRQQLVRGAAGSVINHAGVCLPPSTATNT